MDGDWTVAKDLTMPSVMIEAASNLDAVWSELEPLYLGLHQHHLDLVFGRRLRSDWPFSSVALEGPSLRLILLARDEDVPVGVADGLIRSHPIVEETFGYLNAAYVEPSYRGGLGRRLYEQFEDWCRGHGVPDVRLRVEEANLLGVSVWQGLGFQPFASEMVKVLDSPALPRDRNLYSLPRSLAWATPCI